MSKIEFFQLPPVDGPDRDMYMCLLRLIAEGGNVDYLEWYHLQVMERINVYKN